MENVLSWSAGFVCAYLLVRCLSRMGQVLCWVGLLWLCVVPAQAAVNCNSVGYSLKIHNTSGGAVTWRPINTTGNGCNSGGNQTAVNNTTTTQTVNGAANETFTAQVLETSTGNFRSIGDYTFSTGEFQHTWEFNGNYSDKTDQVICIPGWTNHLSCCVDLQIIVTNTTIPKGWVSGKVGRCPGESIPPMCLTNILGTDINGNGISGTWTLMRSGCEPDDYVPQPIYGGPSSPTPGPGNPGGNPSIPTPPGDPGNDYGAPNGDTNRTGDMMLHQDLVALTKLVSKEAKQDMQLNNDIQKLDLLKQIRDKTNNLTVTNLSDSGMLDELKKIRTNTQASVDLEKFMTNQLNGLMTNGMGGLSNYDAIGAGFWDQGGALEAGANATASNMYMAGLGGRLFTNSADLAGEAVSGYTNVTGLDGNGMGDGGSTDPLTVDFGPNNEYHVGVNLVRAAKGDYGSAVAASAVKVIEGMQWMRHWLELTIAFVLWWAMYGRVREDIQRLSGVAGGFSAKSIDWKQWIGSFAVGLFLMTALTALILQLPTQAMIYIDGVAGSQSYRLPGAATGGIDADLAAGHMGSGSSAAHGWYYILGLLIPFNVIYAALANYLAFLLWGDKLVDFIYSGMRSLKIFRAALIIFGFAIQASYGHEVAIWNAGCTSVVLTNGTEILKVLPGSWTGNLIEGDWGGDVVFTIPEGETTRTVLRFEPVTIDPGMTNTSWNVFQSEARTPVGCWQQGFIFGCVWFGLFWCAQLVIKGLRAGAGYSP